MRDNGKSLWLKTMIAELADVALWGLAGGAVIFALPLLSAEVWRRQEIGWGTIFATKPRIVAFASIAYVIGLGFAAGAHGWWSAGVGVVFLGLLLLGALGHFIERRRSP
jgi:hypothetical protein